MNNLDPTRYPHGTSTDLGTFLAAISAMQPQSGIPQPTANVHGAAPQMWQMQPHPPALSQWPGQLFPQSQGAAVQNAPWVHQLQALYQSAVPNLQHVAAVGPAHQLPYYVQPPAQFQPTTHTQSGPAHSDATRERLRQDGEMDARLKKALKGYKDEGITLREALERIEGVDGRSTAEYFVNNFEQLYPLLGLSRSHSDAGNSSTSSSSQKNSFTTNEEQVDVPEHRRPPRLPRINPHPPEPRRAISRSQTTAAEDIRHAIADEDRVPTRSNTQAWGTGGPRTSLREPAVEFHAGTLIPQTSSSRRPDPPERVDSENSATFTDEDHIFFIHYLRWRLAQNGRLTKASLCAELAAEAPHHDLRAWKAHWDRYSDLPDRICAEFRQRAHASDSLPQQVLDETIPQTSTAVHATSREVLESEGASDDSGSEYDEDEADMHLLPKRARRHFGGPRRKRGGGRSKRKVTEEDVQAMARFKLEKSKEWSSLHTRKSRWEEFAQRPENVAKRSELAWYTIEKTHGELIQMWYRKFKAAARQAAGCTEKGSASESVLVNNCAVAEEAQPEAIPGPAMVNKPDCKTATPGNGTPFAAGDATGEGERRDESGHAMKRSNSQTPEGGSVQKRFKQSPHHEVIELLD